MISFGPVVDDGSRRGAKGRKFAFPNGSPLNSGKFFVSWPLRSARASLGPKEPLQWGLRYSLLACPCAGLCAASADVPAIGTAVHLDLLQQRLFKAALDELGTLGEPVNRVLEVDLDGDDGDLRALRSSFRRALGC